MGTNGFSTIGHNIPEVGMKGVAVEAVYGIWANGYSSYGKGGNNFSIAGEAGGYLVGDVFTPKQAKALDRKIDDGLADHGQVRPGWFTSTDNVAFSSSGNYNLSSTDRVCRLHVFWD